MMISTNQSTISGGILTNERSPLCHKDCPGGTVHQIKCCDMAEFYYSGCNTFSSDYGQPIDCR